MDKRDVADSDGVATTVGVASLPVHRVAFRTMAFLMMSSPGSPLVCSVPLELRHRAEWFAERGLTINRNAIYPRVQRFLA